jgi:hypothetical protein
MSKAPLKHVAKEFGSVVAAIFCLLAISIVTAFANAGLDPTKLLTDENITNLCLNAVTTIFGIVVAIPLGTVYTKQLTTPTGGHGKYLTTYTTYETVRKRVCARRSEFSQWHQQQHLNEQRQKCLNYLLEHNIEQAADIIKLSREQVLSLTETQMFVIDGVETYFKALTHEQIRACIAVLSGKIVVRKLPDFYFLYVDGKGDSTFYDQASHQSRDDTIFLASRLAYKVFIGFVITSIFTSLIISKLSDDVTTREYIIKALVTIFARTFNAISSAYWGFQIGQEQVYRQCYYINGKTQFLETFESDTNFVPVDVQAVAKQEYDSTKGDLTDDV